MASAGTALVQGTAPVAALLRGHPAEDAERLPDGVAVFAGDEPCFAARTAHLALPVRTVDTRTAVARLTRDTADAAGGTCVVLPLGRVYRTGTVRERRIDTDGADALVVWRDRVDDSAERVLAALELAVGTVAADPAAAPVALREPVLRAERGPSRLTARERGERLRWSVRIAAHPGPRGDDWGGHVLRARPGRGPAVPRAGGRGGPPRVARPSAVGAPGRRHPDAARARRHPGAPLGHQRALGHLAP
ncbi:hypothetical protein [Curtobacterium sp. MCJR17_043]|uniref:hypothetical protein n=1 Tax=Curtobacterium sp. MCJR17_043 TaxID=2175660 RepID=UPI0024E02565|nr:hypothetical protein [Curtobacterium sp. MCJR17_043]WIB35282.1 hypothetical protein DEJ15_13185 [Curtobacterium sp. MCJR17_043]